MIVMISTNLNLKRLILIAGDFCVLELSLLITLLIRYQGLSINLWNLHIWPFSLLAVIWLIGFYIAGLYDLSIIREPLKLFRTFLEAMIANLAIGVAFFYLIPVFGIAPRTNLFLYFTICLALGYAWRLLFNNIIVGAFPRGRVLFIGPAEEVERVHRLVHESTIGLDLTVVITTSGSLDRNLDIRWATDFLSFDQLLKEEKINAIVLGLRPEESPELRAALYRTLNTSIILLDRAELEEATTGRVPLSYVSETWFLHHLHEPEKAWYESAKRVADIILAIPVGLVTVVILPIVAMIIKLSSAGPIFYSQMRVGRGGKTFRIWKFRTMQADSEKEGPQFTISAETDPRLFWFGRFLRRTRLDELPQIWNVLRGDLSFIGPRPERPEFVAPLVERMPYYALRHLTRPGLTGWAQVRFLTPTANLEDNLTKLQYDLFYVKHRSFMLDLAILLKTVGIMLRRQGT